MWGSIEALARTRIISTLALLIAVVVLAGLLDPFREGFTEVPPSYFQVLSTNSSFGDIHESKTSV